MRPLAVLRPEPGNAATVARIVAAGGSAIRLPLFAVQPLAWTPVPAADHDALFLTSANAVRQAGAALATYRDLPAYAVGAATAAAAVAAGLNVVATGEDGGEALAHAVGSRGVRRALHLAGRDRVDATYAPVSWTIAVYASAPLPLEAADLLPLAGAVALIHSPRAATRLAGLVADRDNTALAAISAAAASAAGSGWERVAIAARPDDAALVACGLTLANPGADPAAD